MAARDDLHITIGENKAKMLKALELIISKDADAIVASHLLTSVAKRTVSMTDMSDLRLLHNMGYKHFMLSDTVSHRYFEEAMKAWLDYEMLYDFMTEND